ncbi:MAG TPA: type II secretion system F family protein [Caulobacteraceae bacterium]|jgi:tight adherence protein B
MDMTLILMAGMAFVAVAGLGLVFAGVGSGSAKAAKRVQAVARKGRGNLRASRTGAADAVQLRRKQLQAALQEQEKKRRAAAFDAEARLRQAGLNLDVKKFWMLSAGLGLGMTLVDLVMLHFSLPTSLMMGFVVGAGLPLWVVGFLAKQRNARFSMAFADAVDIIVRGLRSGLPLHDCLRVIGKESPEPLGAEFRRLVENLSMGMTLEQGLERMYERLPAPELRFFTIVLNIQQKTGGNLGEALGNLSAVLRGRRMLREKIKALSSEAVASAAVIGCMPPGVAALLSVVNPRYLTVMFTDPRGHLLLAGGAVIMGFGTMVMRKMINFKF